MDTILQPCFDSVGDRIPVTGDLIAFTQDKRIFLFVGKRRVPDVVILPKGSIFIVSSTNFYDEQGWASMKKLELITQFGIQFIIYDESSKPFYVINL